MSHNNCILTLLDLKDKNITFSENWMKDVQINGIRSKVISGILSFQPTHCYNCGHLFDSQIIKHGFKTSRIKMMKLSGFDTYLDLKSNAINAVIVIVPLRLKPLLWNLIVTFLIPLNKLFS